MLRVTSAALAATAAVAAGACGGGAGDKEKIEATVRAYYTAFADGNGAKACEQMSASTRDQFTKAAKTGDCGAAITKATQRPDVKRFTSKLRDAEVMSVKISGETATARVRAIGAETEVPLRKEGEDWKIEGPLGAEPVR